MIRSGFVVTKPAIQGDGVFFLTRRNTWDTDFTAARLFSRRGHAALSPAVRFGGSRDGVTVREVSITLS